MKLQITTRTHLRGAAHEIARQLLWASGAVDDPWRIAFALYLLDRSAGRGYRTAGLAAQVIREELAATHNAYLARRVNSSLEANRAEWEAESDAAERAGLLSLEVPR